MHCTILTVCEEFIWQNSNVIEDAVLKLRSPCRIQKYKWTFNLDQIKEEKKTVKLLPRVRECVLWIENVTRQIEFIRRWDFFFKLFTHTKEKTIIYLLQVPRPSYILGIPMTCLLHNYTIISFPFPHHTAQQTSKTIMSSVIYSCKNSNSHI